MKSTSNQKLEGSKHAYFANQLASCLLSIKIQPKPTLVASAFNKHYRTTVAKPHTVRKWLLGQTQPKSETLLLLARWLKVEPNELISKPTAETTTSNKISFEFDFTDQEVISKYLSMTVKQKVTVRLLIDAIADNDR
jgi:hypothetical protein